MKLALGTAGWRTTYGAIPSKPLSTSEIRSLTYQSHLLGFSWLDTAQGYADSESIIGEISPPQQIATKIVVDADNLSGIATLIDKSLDNLKLPVLNLVFIHNWDSLNNTSKELAVSCLEKLKSLKKISSWGFSTYETSEFSWVVKLGLNGVHIQINSNVLDQRLLFHDLDKSMQEFVNMDNSVWVRSIFLQVILLIPTPSNPFFNHPSVVNFYKYCQATGFSPLEVCLSYAKSLSACGNLILGVNNLKELEEIATAIEIAPSELDLKALKSNDINLIDPRFWKR